jgi:hypothetical protein
MTFCERAGAALVFVSFTAYFRLFVVVFGHNPTLLEPDLTVKLFSCTVVLYHSQERNNMVAGLLTGNEFLPAQEHLLHTTFGDINKDASLVGTARYYRSGEILPTVQEIDDWLDEYAADFYTDDEITYFLESEFYAVICKGPVYGEWNRRPCCNKIHLVQAGSPMTVHDAFDLVLHPPAMAISASPSFQVLFECPRHGRSYGKRAGISYSNNLMSERPLTVYDLTHSLSPMFSSYVYMHVTPLEVLNAQGVDVPMRKGDPGFDTSFGIDSKGFGDLYSPFREFAEEGYALVWMLLAGWRSKNTRALASRIEITKELSTKLSAPQVLEYLRAGVPNVRELTKFVNEGISLQTTRQAYASGITNFTTIKKMGRMDIDMSLVASMMDGAV